MSQSPTSDYDYYFTPTTTGTYTLTFNFPATTVTAANDPTSTLIGDTYTPATASTTLTVQSTPIAALPQTPLPTAFWTRPIYGENTAWYALGSNWLGFGSPGYIALGGGPNLGGNGEEFGSTTNVGSLTSHVMWTMPLAPWRSRRTNCHYNTGKHLRRWICIRSKIPKSDNCGRNADLHRTNQPNRTHKWTNRLL